MSIWASLLISAQFGVEAAVSGALHLVGGALHRAQPMWLISTLGPLLPYTLFLLFSLLYLSNFTLSDNQL